MNNEILITPHPDFVLVLKKEMLVKFVLHLLDLFAFVTVDFNSFTKMGQNSINN